MLSGERANENHFHGLLSLVILYHDRRLSASRAKRFWKPITRTDHLHRTCDDEIDFLFESVVDIDQGIDQERWKEDRERWEEEQRDKECEQTFGKEDWEKHKAEFDEMRRENLREQEEEKKRKEMLDRDDGG